MIYDVYYIDLNYLRSRAYHAGWSLIRYLLSGLSIPLLAPQTKISSRVSWRCKLPRKIPSTINSRSLSSTSKTLARSLMCNKIPVLLYLLFAHPYIFHFSSQARERSTIKGYDSSTASSLVHPKTFTQQVQFLGRSVDVQQKPSPRSRPYQETNLSILDAIHVIGALTFQIISRSPLRSAAVETGRPSSPRTRADKQSEPLLDASFPGQKVRCASKDSLL